jgi:hypothetical protein
MKRLTATICLTIAVLLASARAESSDYKCSKYLQESNESIWGFRSTHCLDYRRMVANAPEGYEEMTSVAEISSDTQTDGGVSYVVVFRNGMRADGSLYKNESPKLRNLLTSIKRGARVRLKKLMGAPLVCSEKAAIAHGLGIWLISVDGKAANELLTFTGTTRQCGGSGTYGLKNPDTDEETDVEKMDLARRAFLLTQ